jgi:hypothetical protein
MPPRAKKELKLASPLPAAPPPPGVPVPPSPQTGGMIDPLSMTLFSLNSNPYLIGIFMILLNLGARFLPMELTKQQEAFLQHGFVRPIILFVVIFIGTRNLAVAFWLTLGIFSLLWFFANEKSTFCMIPGWCEQSHEPPQEHSTLYEKNLSQVRSHLNYAPEYQPMLNKIVQVPYEKS